MPLSITHDKKICLTHQIFSLFAEYGVDGISMDEVAKQIKLSKATIYKYFKSKEDIAREIVYARINCLNAIKLTADAGIEGVLESLSAIYFEGVVTGAYATSKFMTDLHSKFPDILFDYIAALESNQKKISSFFERAVMHGYFKQVSVDLICMQVKMMLPTITKSDYLNVHNTTLPIVIREYYKLLLYQFLSVEYMNVINLDSTYFFVDELIEFLKSRFLIN